MRKSISAIFDIGKTNKKLLLFDDKNQIIEEQQTVFPEIEDDDGFPCEDVAQLTEWVTTTFDTLHADERFTIKGLNFATYGASFVHLDKKGNVVAPLYNYLKPMPEELQVQFDKLINKLGQTKEAFAAATCSPPMGMLNSGLQLYFIKYTKPDLYKQIGCSLHLPQYLAFLFSRVEIADFTSIGCHTALWDFAKGDYHDWVYKEKIDKKLTGVIPNRFVGKIESDFGNTFIGTGLHDSSAALLPYRGMGNFLLLSTGTWCINLNPFNNTPLSINELEQDCLCYLTPEGNPVKASRVFFGREHDYQVERIAAHFSVENNFFKSIGADAIVGVTQSHADNKQPVSFIPACMTGTGPFPKKAAGEWDLTQFATPEVAYLALMRGLMDVLKVSIQLVDNGVPTFYVDGGFARNPIFITLLKQDFPTKNIETKEVPQATALGALLRMQKG
jgi:L-fuculokinase